MVALGNDRTGGALFFFPYLLPFSSLYPFFFFLLANWGHDAYSERFEQIPYAKLGGAERIHFGSFPLFSLRALVFSFNSILDA
jgi:hypothetical protein